MKYVLLMILLMSCAQMKRVNINDYIVEVDDFKKEPAIFTPEAVTKDIDVLLHFYKQGYIGAGFIDKSLLSKVTRKIKGLKYDSEIGSWEKLCEKISVSFEELPDGHLGSYFNRKSCLPKKYKLRASSKIGTNIAKGYTEKAYKIKTISSNSKKVGIVGITRFPSFHDKRWSNFEESIKKLKELDSIIIDLRGNGGGDDSRGMELASILNGVPILKSSYSEHFERTNKETYTLILNKITSKEIQSSKNAWKIHRSYFEKKFNKKHKYEYERKLSGRLDFLKEEYGNSYKNKIFVLVDSECGSSGESTMMALKQLENVKVIGQNTAGVTHFGNQGTLILPNSKIRVAMSTKFIRYLDDTFVEKTGHGPDIYVKDGVDALSYTLNSLLN